MYFPAARITGFIVLLAACTAALAEPDVAAGKKAYASCRACHGNSAEGNKALQAPRLAHLGTPYLVAQLAKFRTGLRGGSSDSSAAQQMAAMAATLATDQAVIDVAGYIASLDGPAGAATLSGNAAVGADYYNQLCGACHGSSGQGNPALRSPRLAGGDDWYLFEQMRAFRDGGRGSHPQDRTGKQMRAMAALLPDDETLTDVVVFLRGLSP